MENWIADLAAFVADEKGYSYGTSEPDEFKVLTPQGEIVIQKDVRWKELLELADVFSGYSTN